MIKPRTQWERSVVVVDVSGIKDPIVLPSPAGGFA
jgi:hypothetical protein